MENKSNELLENKNDEVSVMAKVYQGPREKIYSYLNLKEMIKVATLSKRERQTVLNSRIIKENRNDFPLLCMFSTNFFSKYSSDMAV